MPPSVMTSTYPGPPRTTRAIVPLGIQPRRRDEPFIRTSVPAGKDLSCIIILVLFDKPHSTPPHRLNNRPAPPDPLNLVRALTPPRNVRATVAADAEPVRAPAIMLN